MSKGNTFENDLLLLIFNNTDIADVGDAAGLQNSATAGSLYVSLHTTDPGEAGSQTTNEIAYTSYARAAVARSGAGWTVSGNSVSNAAEVAFPACTGGTASPTYFGVGVTSGTGAGKLLYSGALTGSPPSISTGITPRFLTGQITITED